jgi:hypothetical protein
VGAGSGAGTGGHARGRAGTGAKGAAANVDDILEQLLHAARGSSSRAETDETKTVTGFSATPEALVIAEALAAVEGDADASEPPHPLWEYSFEEGELTPAIVTEPPVPTPLAVSFEPSRPLWSHPSEEGELAPAVEPPRSLWDHSSEEGELAPAVEAPRLLPANSSEEGEWTAVVAASASPLAVTEALADEPKAATKPSLAWGPREVQGEALPEPQGPFPQVEAVRRRHLWPIFICVAAVFIITTGLLTYFNRSLLAEQAEYHAVIQRQGNGYLDESIALIQEADSVIVALDRATESQIAEEDIPRLEALLDKTSSVQDSLDGAIDKALQAKETFLDDESKQLAQYAQDAAGYRKRMLEMSSEIVRYDIAAMRSALALEYAWTLIIDADANMRSAVETVVEGGAGAVTESRDYNQEAVNKLVLADEALDKAVEAFSAVDVGTLRAYLAAKKASAELALASDEAFLEGSYYTANLRNEEFIEKDAEAVELASAIPGDLLSLVVTAYEQAIGPLRQEYVAVRSQATDVDAYLRAYLGVDVQLDLEVENGE